MSKTPQFPGINVPHIMTWWYCVEYRGRDGKGGKVKPPFPYHSPTVPPPPPRPFSLVAPTFVLFLTAKNKEVLQKKCPFLFSPAHTQHLEYSPAFPPCRLPTPYFLDSHTPPPPPQHLPLKQVRSPVILRTLSFPFVRTGQPEWLVCEWSASFWWSDPTNYLKLPTQKIIL